MSGIDPDLVVLRNLSMCRKWRILQKNIDSEYRRDGLGSAPRLEKLSRLTTWWWRCIIY